MENKKVLGKGLSALIGDGLFDLNDNESANNEFLPDQKVDIPTNEIELSPFQPRQRFNDDEINDLAESIRIHGVLQPILVRKHNGAYQIIAGERRYRACTKLGLRSIPAIIKDCDDRKMFEIALIENIQRENLDPIEEALAISKLMNDLELTQEKVSASIGKSRSYIANSLRLLTLPERIQNLVIEKKISAGHARALIGKPNQEEIVNRILRENLSVREVENSVQKPERKKAPKREAHHNFFKDPADKDEALVEIERGLSESLGMKVYIRETEQGGQLVVNFLSLDQLDELIRKLSGTNIGF